jgi:hypothetical protein
VTGPRRRRLLLAQIRGNIVAAATGKPIHRVRVALGAASDAPFAVTDTRGDYEITDVPAGSYTLTASRAGYLTIQYGQRYPREAGRTITLDAGEMLNDVNLLLPRWGVLAGTVSDELGEPFAGVNVEAVELRYVRGRRVPLQAAATRANDLGQFRISGLQPGTYMLRASTTDTWQDDDSKTTFVYAATCFPGVTTTAEAQSVSVAVGQQVNGLAIALRPGRAATISGVVRGATGNPVAAQAIHLSRITRGVGGALVSSGPSRAGDVRTDTNGAFVFQNLPPGEYTVSSGASEGIVETVIVADGDTKAVLLTAKEPATVAGTVVTADGSPLPFVPTRLRVVPISSDPDLLFVPWAAAREAPVTRDATFRINNADGQYLYRINGLPDGWMVTGVMLSGRNHVDTPLEVAAGVETSGVQLVVGNNGATVTGTVVTRDGIPAPDSTVIVFPPESGRWTIGSRFIKAVRPDNAGRFSVRGLPAGSYRVAVRDFVAEGQWEDPEFLATLLATSTRVEVTAGAEAAAKLTLEPQP